MEGGCKEQNTRRNMGNTSGGDVRVCVCEELALFYVNLNLSSGGGYQPC